MFLNYFILNFMPLMILLGIAALMYVIKDAKIPATNLFTATMVIMFALTLIAMINTSSDISGLSASEAKRIIFSHTLASSLS